jgi:hypothetical protein
MADKDDSVLDKAETVARRIFERLGSTFDSKKDTQTLGPREVGDLTSRIERVIEASLREDKDGVKRVAPNLFKILFTYEQTTRFSPGYLEALGKELKGSIFEFINNRRYEIRGPITVETGSDLFAKAPVIKPSFQGDEEAAKPGGLPLEVVAGTTAKKRAAGTCEITLTAEDGQRFTLELRTGGAPAYVGRVAGNAIVINHLSVSRLHSSVALRADGQVVVADLGSANGTCVNGELLVGSQARAVDEGDVVSVGDVKLTISHIGR